MSQAQQPEALRLADALAYCDSSVAAQAARELRSLHARIAELEAAPAAQAVEPEANEPAPIRVSLPIHWMKELVALCGPEQHELRDRVLKSLERVQTSAPAAVAVPNGWREKFAAEVYANLAAADNQDIPLEDYPARILKVLDSIVGPRHPVVIQWRNDAIQNCIAISYKYCRDPESHKYLKQDLEALLAATPPAQMGDSPVSNVETTDPQAQDVQREADMFWDSDDGERCEHDIESLIEGYSDGAILKIERAKSLPSITIRVIQSAEGADYEIIDRAAIAASAAQGEA